MGQQFPYRLQTGARWSAWRLRWLPALALAGFTGLWSAPAAAAITLDSISVERDGSPGTFDADDLPGHDSSPINGWVRTQDEMAFKVSYHSSGTTADTITLQVPQGMKIALVLGLGVAKAQRVIAPMHESGATAYWRDAEGVHYVPKRSLEDLIIARF